MVVVRQQEAKVGFSLLSLLILILIQIQRAMAPSKPLIKLQQRGRALSASTAQVGSAGIIYSIAKLVHVKAVLENYRFYR